MARTCSVPECPAPVHGETGLLCRFHRRVVRFGAAPMRKAILKSILEDQGLLRGSGAPPGLAKRLP